MKSRTVAALLVSLAFGLPSFAAAGVKTEAPQTQVSPDRDAWVNRIREAREQLTTAQARYATAMRNYGQMMHRRRERGQEKLDVLAAREAARTEVTEAQQRVDALREEARRAGVPPGWLRDAMAGPDPAAPAN